MSDGTEEHDLFTGTFEERPPLRDGELPVEGPAHNNAQPAGLPDGHKPPASSTSDDSCGGGDDDSTLSNESTSNVNRSGTSGTPRHDLIPVNNGPAEASAAGGATSLSGASSATPRGMRPRPLVNAGSRTGSGRGRKLNKKNAISSISEIMQASVVQHEAYMQEERLRRQQERDDRLKKLEAMRDERRQEWLQQQNQHRMMLEMHWCLTPFVSSSRCQLHITYP